MISSIIREFHSHATAMAAISRAGYGVFKTPLLEYYVADDGLHTYPAVEAEEMLDCRVDEYQKI
jgi:hypothetical protein